MPEQNQEIQAMIAQALSGAMAQMKQMNAAPAVPVAAAFLIAVLAGAAFDAQF